MDRPFLDANVLHSAAYRENSGLRRLWELGGVELLTSAYAFEEARRNLDTDEPLERLQKLVRALDLVPESAVELPLGVELSEKDIPILQAALAAEASHLITGDRRDFGRYLGKRLEGVWVMTPRQYLEAREA
ncbi:MAG TPA: PIN domain-containing protein [Vicinamibacteria bacterium]|nr:PIN domain-containing protein [Vicinamibacteria bacterium]